METITIAVKDNSTSKIYKIKIDEEELDIFLKVVGVFNKEE